MVDTFADMTLDRPRVMGVVNVTPDSFSDGGLAFDRGDAIRHGLGLWEAGADILDIGGESTRPGAAPVMISQELDRVIPVIEALSNAGCRVSVDTRHAAVMREAVSAGARIINDVSALQSDPDSLQAVIDTGSSVVLMHMQGTPETMQAAPHYENVTDEVCDYLAARIDVCVNAGIARERIAIDPGIGFGKTVEHNVTLLAHMDRLCALGVAVVLGVSRKSFIGHLSGEQDARRRLPGSIAANLAGIARGAHILRVHDVAETVQALKIWRAIEQA